MAKKTKSKEILSDASVGETPVSTPVTEKKTNKTTKSTKKTTSSTSTKDAKKGASPSPPETTPTEPSKPTKSVEPEEPVVKEVITVGADIEEDYDSNDEDALEKMGKWWLQEPWRSLLDPELGKNVDLASFDISSLIEQFIDKMLKEDLVDFRISGLAIYSSAKYYHQKITSVITEEEIIQREQERERLRREIPKALSQPIREARKLATTEELFGAMRRAIIETMQKREKLRIRREQQLSKKETLVERRGKGKLPAEILKHITGNDKTIEQRLQETHQKIKEIIALENFSENSFPLDYIKKMIYSTDTVLLEKKVKYMRLFEELLVLMSLNKIGMQQRSMKSPVKITLLDKTPIELI